VDLRGDAAKVVADAMRENGRKIEGMSATMRKQADVNCKRQVRRVLPAASLLACLPASLLACPPACLLAD
jgi:hypothetical protein